MPDDNIVIQFNKTICIPSDATLLKQPHMQLPKNELLNLTALYYNA